MSIHAWSRLAALAFSFMFATQAAAQPYPSRSIKIVVPATPTDAKTPSVLYSPSSSDPTASSPDLCGR